MIQKHDATRLHYDFRLELDGVFKSWAVTRGPSLDPADKRLAVEVEDHPLDYGDFEGTIPKGQYGGGTVMLWDRGFWEPEGDADKMLAKGDLKFILDGEKLKGGWVLVRMRSDKSARQAQQLAADQASRRICQDGDGEAILEKDHSVASGRAMEADRGGHGREAHAIHARQGLQGGCGLAVEEPRRRRKSDVRAPRRRKPRRSRQDKIAAVLPRFVEPQLCRLVDQPPSGAGWVHEIKFDGYRMQLRVEDGKATLRTRKGLDWTAKFAAIARPAAKLAGLHPRRRSRARWITTARRISPACRRRCRTARPDGLIFFAFDLLFEEGEDLRPLPLADRKERLATLLKAQRRHASATSSISPAAAMRF